jgi:PAS domain S-box-containing protein
MRDRNGNKSCAVDTADWLDNHDAERSLGKVRFMEDENITQKNGEEITCQEHREELQIIFDAVPAWIFYKDKENRFLRVNRAFCDIMEMSREELEGRSLYELYPRDQAEAYWKDDKEVMASGKPKRDILESMDHKSGRLWVRTDKIPYRNAQGVIIGTIGFSIEITAQKNMEDELRAAYEEEQQLRLEHEQLADQLRSALKRIRTLDSLLPVCAVCKKIRDENGHWHHMVSYISSRTDTQFSHGYCPECAQKAMADAGLIEKKPE